MNFVERERKALNAHRATIYGESLPPAPRAGGAFLHGFFLPFSLIAALLRDPVLRRPYLRLTLLRLLLVVFVGVIAIATGGVSSSRQKPKPKRTSASTLQLGSLQIDLSKAAKDRAPALAKSSAHKREVHTEESEAKDIAGAVAEVTRAIRGTHTPNAPNAPNAPDAPEEDEGDDGDESVSTPLTASASAEPPRTGIERAWGFVRETWSWLLALVAILSATEGVLVAFSRKWDDWLSYHAARIAKIVPEDSEAPTPGVAFDPKWLWRKAKRRIRGYILFATGLPFLLPLRLIPGVGYGTFVAFATVWGWYWLGVFSAAKSAHAWADESTAPSPQMIRALNENLPHTWITAPLRWYGRIWAKLTRSVNPATTTFERSPAAFLGLALARAILAFPGLYLLARPIVPVAAGRICAESDPEHRFGAGLQKSRSGAPPSAHPTEALALTELPEAQEARVSETTSTNRRA
jgi:hypothetical protein